MLMNFFKIRYGSASYSKAPSNSIIASPIKVVIPFDGRQEFVQLNNTKVSSKTIEKNSYL